MNTVYTVKDFQKSDLCKMTGLVSVFDTFQLADISQIQIDSEVPDNAAWIDYYNAKLQLAIGICLDFKFEIVRVYRFECNLRSFDEAFCALLTGIKNYAGKFFNRIEMFASGNLSTFEKYPLYFYCAKFGFTPHPTYLPEILQVEEKAINFYRRSEFNYSSIDNLFHTDEGLLFWKSNGFEWLAEFSLDKDSDNLQYLRKELFLSGRTNWLL